MNKNIILCLLLLVLGYQAIAQDSTTREGFTFQADLRYLAATKASVSHPPGYTFDDGTYGKSFRLYAGYYFTPKINLNVGIGADRYEVASANTFPLVIQARYYLSETKSSFYTFAEAGPQISFSDASDKGYVFALCAGRSFSLTTKMSLNAYLGYNYQKTTDTFVNLGKIDRQSLLIGVGLQF
ncbi:MAG: hypothetical protein JEZ14_26080 [Marinilabiliaceae bacterium]|nr:hypothetical protein [Marinilabiliaceae bacterium]